MERSAHAILTMVMECLFGSAPTLSLEQARHCLAWDLHLPVPVDDAFTGASTWVSDRVRQRYVDLSTSRSLGEGFWDRSPAVPRSMEEVRGWWSDVNVKTASRQIDCSDVFESDDIHGSQRVVRSQRVRNCQDVLWCDAVTDSRFVVASKQSTQCEYSARIDSSRQCSESFEVSWSHQITRCAYIEDCADMFESMFCAHLRGKRYCIGNRQFDEHTYFTLKPHLLAWMKDQLTNEGQAGAQDATPSTPAR